MKFLASLAPEISKIKPGEMHPDYSGLMEVSKKSIAEWCVEDKVPNVVDLLIGPLIVVTTIGRPEEASMAHPVALLSGMEGMGRIHGSYGALNGSLYEKVKRNMRLNTKVAEIVIEDGVAKGVKLEGGELLEADNAVLRLYLHHRHRDCRTNCRTGVAVRMKGWVNPILLCTLRLMAGQAA